MGVSDDVVEVYKALADRTRLSIVRYLAHKDEAGCGELSSCFKLSQPTMSHHYRKLQQAGILKVREEGVSHFYSIDKQLLKKCGIDLLKLG